MKKQEAQARRYAMRIVMEDIARGVGKDARLYKLMGSVAWGRYQYEGGGADSSATAHLGIGYLEGMRDTLLRVVREFGLPGERDLADFWSRVSAEEERRG